MLDSFDLVSAGNSMLHHQGYCQKEFPIVVGSRFKFMTGIDDWLSLSAHGLSTGNVGKASV